MSSGRNFQDQLSRFVLKSFRVTLTLSRCSSVLIQKFPFETGVRLVPLSALTHKKPLASYGKQLQFIKIRATLYKLTHKIEVPGSLSGYHKETEEAI